MNATDKLSREIIANKIAELDSIGANALARYVLTLEYSVVLLQRKVDKLNGSK